MLNDNFIQYLAVICGQVVICQYGLNIFDKNLSNYFYDILTDCILPFLHFNYVCVTFWIFHLFYSTSNCYLYLLCRLLFSHQKFFQGKAKCIYEEWQFYPNLTVICCGQVVSYGSYLVYYYSYCWMLTLASA